MEILIVALLIVILLQGMALIYLNQKNRKLAREGVAAVLATRNHAKRVHRIVDDAIGKPPPPTIPDPPPSDLNRERRRK